MLTCLYNGNFFDNDQEGFSEIEKRLLGKEKKLICPICNKAVYYNSKGKVISHFSHYPGMACDEKSLKSHDVDDVIHDNTKVVVSKWVRSNFNTVIPVKDRYLPEVRQLADIYFETDKARVAIEIQFKHITPEKIVEREENYRKLGIKCIWIFARNGIIDPGSPYERHYYKINNRELYYIDINKDLFTYYKGLKMDKFDTACVRLTHYIKHSCSLNEISINQSGALELPGWRKAYKQKLQDVRKTLHEEMRKKRLFKESIQEKYKYKLNYKLKNRKNVDITLDKPEAKTTWVQGSFLNMTGNTNPTQKTGEQEYDKITLKDEGKRKYLILTLKGSVTEVKYEIKTQQDSSSFTQFVCRQLINGIKGPVSKGYVIKVFKDRKTLTIDEWF